MEIAAVGNNYQPSKPKKAATPETQSGFQQVLTELVHNQSPNQRIVSKEDQHTSTAAESLLLFLKSKSIQQVPDAMPADEIQISDEGLSNLQHDSFQIIKKLLGISDQKWSQLIAEVVSKLKGKPDVQDPINVLIEGLAGLNFNQPIAPRLNENMILFVKAAKVYSLLSDQAGAKEQDLTRLLDSVKNQLQAAVQSDMTQTKRTNLQNTFSQLVSEMKIQTAGGSASANQNKQAVKLTDWNNSSPFIQLMSKPEQLAVMTAGTQKSVSVNDLIQQFETILSKSQFSKMGGTQKLLIKLNPEHLGALRIELIQKDHLITAKILTTTEAAKEALESHIHNLKHTFEAQNIKVDNVEVGQQPSSQSQQDDFLNQDQRDQQEQLQNQKQEKDGNSDLTDAFSLTLEEAILNQKI